MQLNYPRASKLWEYINSTHLSEDKLKELKGGNRQDEKNKSKT